MQCFNVAKTIATSFSGFSSSCPYGARGRETLVGSGHVCSGTKLILREESLSVNILSGSFSLFTQ